MTNALTPEHLSLIDQIRGQGRCTRFDIDCGDPDYVTVDIYLSHSDDACFGASFESLQVAIQFLRRVA